MDKNTKAIIAFLENKKTWRRALGDYVRANDTSIKCALIAYIIATQVFIRLPAVFQPWAAYLVVLTALIGAVVFAIGVTRVKMGKKKEVNE